MKERLDVLLVKRNLVEIQRKSESSDHVGKCIRRRTEGRQGRNDIFRMRYRSRSKDIHFHMSAEAD